MKYYAIFYSLRRHADHTLCYVEVGTFELDRMWSMQQMRFVAAHEAMHGRHDGWRIGRIATKSNSMFLLTADIQPVLCEVTS